MGEISSTNGRESRNAYTILAGKTERKKNNLGDLDVDGRKY
jgi:hypothetical protein